MYHMSLEKRLVFIFLGRKKVANSGREKKVPSAAVLNKHKSRLSSGRVY